MTPRERAIARLDAVAKGEEFVEPVDPTKVKRRGPAAPASGAVRTANSRALLRQGHLESQRALLALQLTRRLNKRINMYEDEILNILRHPHADDGPRVQLLKALLEAILPSKREATSSAKQSPTAAVQIVIEGVNRGVRQLPRAIEVESVQDVSE